MKIWGQWGQWGQQFWEKCLKSCFFLGSDFCLICWPFNDNNDPWGQHLIDFESFFMISLNSLVLYFIFYWLFKANLTISGLF